MSYELIVPSKRSKKTNSVSISYIEIDGRRRIGINMSDDLATNYFSSCKKVKILSDTEKKAILLIPAKEDDAKAFAFPNKKPGRSRFFSFAWKGTFPGASNSISAKFEKEEYQKEVGIKIFLPN